jgi:hypothetical protein
MPEKVEHLKACCMPDQLQQLEAIGFNWAALEAALPQLVAMLIAIFGKSPATKK